MLLKQKNMASLFLLNSINSNKVIWVGRPPLITFWGFTKLNNSDKSDNFFFMESPFVQKLPKPPPAPDDRKGRRATTQSPALKLKQRDVAVPSPM